MSLLFLLSSFSLSLALKDGVHKSEKKERGRERKEKHLRHVEVEGFPLNVQDYQSPVTRGHQLFKRWRSSFGKAARLCGSTSTLFFSVLFSLLLAETSFEFSEKIFFRYNIRDFVRKRRARQNNEKNPKDSRCCSSYKVSVYHFHLKNLYRSRSRTYLLGDKWKALVWKRRGRVFRRSVLYWFRSFYRFEEVERTTEAADKARQEERRRKKNSWAFGCWWWWCWCYSHDENPFDSQSS